MYNRLKLNILYVPVVLLFLSLCILGCSGRINEELETNPSSTKDAVIVYETDSTEWTVKIFKKHIYYSAVASIEMPDHWHIPTRSEAQILRTCTYPHTERFVTCDGYTFAMPSSSVSKAGQKTAYSVLGLYIRSTCIEIQF